MLLRDLREIPTDETIEADICVVGSGPAGATIVRELAGSSLRVILLESGGIGRQPEADALSEVENIGAPRVSDQSIMRTRVLGGTSSLWTGRCAPLDAVDYTRRPWVPHSGWPIDPGELTPYLDRTAQHLGLGLGSGFTEAGPPTRPAQTRPEAGTDPDKLRPFYWQYSRDTQKRHDSMRFARSILAERADNVRVITNASLVHINTDATASRTTSLEAAGPSGERRTITASTVVLCAGGIENARLLLTSNRIAPSGLGNARDVVGRYLMDHPRGGLGRFDHHQAGALRTAFGLQPIKTGKGTHLFLKGFRLSPAVQEREGLLNCSVWLSEWVTDDDPWSAAKRLARGRGNMVRDARAIAANFGLFAQGLHRGFIRGGVIPRKLSALELDCTVEQQPDPDSRVTLSQKLDRNGTPLSRVDWRVNEREQQTVRRTAQLVAQEFQRLGLPALTLNDWIVRGAPFPADFQDVAHHIGTTRMAADPREGVVDRHCQVHGVDGLYVAGSSVFPTGGHANPTQTIVALAVRLADTLKRRHQATASLAHTPATDSARPSVMPTVGVQFITARAASVG